MSLEVVGRSVRQFDLEELVTGRKVYCADRVYENQLVMKVLFANRPHARVVAIDTRLAEAQPGVIGVLTAVDVPVNEYGQVRADQPVLCGPGSKLEKPGQDVVRFVGDQVALVIAEDEQTAVAARDAINVTYENLPVVDDLLTAGDDTATQLHHDAPNNIADSVRIRKGDVEAAWEDCDVFVESTARVPFQEHAYLQTEAGVAYLDDEGRITVHTAGQWAWEDQQEIAHALDLSPERVRVVYDGIGGAFGGKEDVSVQIILALAVWWLDQRGIRRPVKTVWDREECTIGHSKRHPMIITSKWGAKTDGTLVAAKIELIADGGAYLSTSNKVLRNAAICATGPYYFSAVHLDGRAMYTNNLFSGAFRGFGATQGHLAAELQMNMLANRLGIDPVELRLKNALTDKTPTSLGTLMPGGVNLQEVISEAARVANWEKRGGNRPVGALDHDNLPTVVRGRGFAAAFKNVGFGYGIVEASWAQVEVRGSGDVEEAIIRIDGAECGQGHHTVMAQIAAEVLGISYEQVSISSTDTALVGSQSAGSAAASRLTFMGGNAVKKAAAAAYKKWVDGESPATADGIWEAPPTSELDPETGHSIPAFGYGYVAQVVDLTLNTETGVIQVDNVVCVDDVGKVINPERAIGQVEGCIGQAHGYSVLEDFRVEGGYVLTPNLSTYLIPGVFDIPAAVETVLMEIPHPEGPYGARGIGEIPYLPYAPALLAAVHDATGVWFDELPLTPERVLRGLGHLN